MLPVVNRHSLTSQNIAVTCLYRLCVRPLAKQNQLVLVSPSIAVYACLLVPYQRPQAFEKRIVCRVEDRVTLSVTEKISMAFGSQNPVQLLCHLKEEVFQNSQVAQASETSASHVVVCRWHKIRRVCQHKVN